MVLTLTLLMPLVALFPAAAEESYDNSDLGNYYSTFDCYLGCDQLYDGALSSDAASSPAPVPSPFSGISTYILTKTGDFLFNKALNKLWTTIFGGDGTAEQLSKIIDMLDEIKRMLDRILDELKSMDYCRYLNERMKERVALYAEVRDTLGKLQEAEEKFEAKKLTQKELNAERKRIVLEWNKKKINKSNSGFTATVAFAEQMMQLRSNGLGYFGMVDAFAYNFFPFESAGYDFREQQRAEEIMVYAYGAALSAMALQQEANDKTDGDTAEISARLQQLKELTDKYDQFYKSNTVDRSPTQDYEIVQIKGLQGSKIKKEPVRLMRAEDFKKNVFYAKFVDSYPFHSMRGKLIPAKVLNTMMEFFKVVDQRGTTYTMSMGQLLTDEMNIDFKNQPYDKSTLLLTNSDYKTTYKQIDSERQDYLYQVDLYAKGYQFGSLEPDESLWFSYQYTEWMRSIGTQRTESFLAAPMVAYGLEFTQSKHSSELMDEPSDDQLTGTVMHVSEDGSTAYVLGELTLGDGSVSQGAFEVDVSAANPDYTPVNGLNVDMTYRLNESEDGAIYTASAFNMPEPETVTGTVSLFGDGVLSVLSEDGAEHAFTLPETLTFDQQPGEGMDVSVTYVPVTPVIDWMAEEYAGSEGDSPILPDEKAPAEYVLNVALGDNAISATLDGTVSAMAGEYMTVLDEQGAEHAFQLTEATKLDADVEEGAQVRVTYHAAKEEIVLAEGVPVADGIALLVSPVEPEEEEQELDGTITYADEDTLQVQADDGSEYAFDLTNAQIEGEPAEGNPVHVVYRETVPTLTAAQVTCFAPEEEDAPADDVTAPEDVVSVQE